jgi:Putative transposase
MAPAPVWPGPLAVAPISGRNLENLCRYITRPAIANERLKRNRAGDVVLQLNSAFKDGHHPYRHAPLEFMQRLAALVPRPRLHLIRFHGVVAPNEPRRTAEKCPEFHSRLERVLRILGHSSMQAYP